MEEQEPKKASHADLRQLTQDLRSFLSQLESDGYTKESLVLLLSKFETVFKTRAEKMPSGVRQAIDAFIQHGFEYAEGKEGQQPLIHDLEKLQAAIAEASKKSGETS